MTAPERGSIAAIVLAAGASTRLGQPKQLVEFFGERLLERAVRIAGEAGCQPVIVVLGASAQEIRKSLRAEPGNGVAFVFNHAWAEGMASSIRAGVGSLPPEVAGTVILTCDQPSVTPEHLKSLIDRDPEATTASAYAGRRGVPAYFPRSVFAELERIVGENGARSLLAGAATVALEGGEFDLDTPDDLRILRRMKRS
jgi:CTP:molybdopterin cytidylyltransferase MocA